MQIYIRQLFIIASAVLMLSLSTIAPAAYYPAMVYSTPTTISPGVTYRTANHANPLWSIHVIEIDTTNPNVELVPVEKQAQALERTSAMALRSDAVAAVNAGFFNTASPYQSVSYMIKDGLVVYNSGGNFSAIGFTGNHQQDAYRTKVAGGNVPADSTNWPRVMDAIAGIGSFTTTGGVATVDTEGWAAASTDVRHPRTMIGFRRAAPARVWLVAVDGRQAALSVGMSFTEEARFMADLGAEESVNLDGGGSTAAWVKGRIMNSPSDGNERAVCTAWIVAAANTVDNTDTEATFTGSWQGHAPFDRYGANSLRATGPAGDSTATWSPALAVDGRYKVYAWWTGGADRASDATYQITHRDGTASVSVDQRANAGAWQLLGTYNLSSAPGAAKVSISNDVAGVVAADAVRFVRVTEMVERWTKPVGSFPWFQNDSAMRASTINQATGNVIAASTTAASGGVFVLSNADGSVLRQLGGSAAIAAPLSFTGAASTRTGKIFVTSLVTTAGTDNHSVYYWPSETAAAPITLTGSAPARVGDSIDAYEDLAGNITLIVTGNQPTAPTKLLKYYMNGTTGTWISSTVTVSGSSATGLRNVAIKQTGGATYEIWLKAISGAISRFNSNGTYLGTAATPGTSLMSNFYFGREPVGPATVEYYVTGPYGGSGNVELFTPTDPFVRESAAVSHANTNTNGSGGYGIAGVAGRLFVSAGITNNSITLFESSEPALALPGSSAAVDGWELY